MGATHPFVCSGCGYEAQVSGGPGMGSEARTETVVRRVCRELFEIIVGSSRDDEPVEARGLFCDEGEGLDPQQRAPVIEPGDPAPRRAPRGKRYAECRSRRLFLWSRANGCPKCGSAMTRGSGPTILWD